MLTPLPGTDLGAEVKNQLITHDYDYFDFIHTVLPTALSLKEFYEEYHRLYTKAIPFTKGLSLVNKFPLKEIPSILTKTYRWRRRLRTAYLDFGKHGLKGSA